MKAGDRKRVEAQVDALAGFHVGIGWLAHYHEAGVHALADPDTREIFLVMGMWRKSDNAERADTIAHEIAHLWAPHDGHNTKWARCLMTLLPLAEALTW